ncbi:prolipoprotein diacylglyceryl transferase [Candidatus Bodocaedibacter vickermanii]|uniref:Phosphatidylglycerol--prolipoprotein diacylglyceryl transferase n=1 Tax=Candidatus Bodocaedibacter vickermanii TaxID=2741701 RepID=A0A7L9RTQ4_9PROT|nr:Prolipoprotein diacylglyceryl transferase [Candidatus Paracaedibacteraceae bacterium 'Lake Konstanz']
MFVIPFHNIDPVIFQISSAMSLNWYGISYLAGVVFVMWASDRMASKRPAEFPANVYKNCMFWGMMAIVIGGRLGDVLFYNFDYYMYRPLEIFATWKGGMSFHGGLIGVIIAAVLYARYHKVKFTNFMDVLSVNVPIALMFGRLANFINGELYGRPTDVAWAIPFPKGGNIPRHPSQLYEAMLEGVVLYGVLRLIYKCAHKKSGVTASSFLIGYGLARFVAEYFRDSETLSWFHSNWLSGGQILSVPMIVIGIGLLGFFWRQSKPETRQ